MIELLSRAASLLRPGFDSEPQGDRSHAPGSTHDADAGPVLTDLAQFSAEARELAEKDSLQGKSDPVEIELSDEERARVQELRAIDQEVRAHEQAHRVAAGDLARGATSFEYTVGPDGQRYAVGGEVQIDTSPIPGDAKATIAKALRIISAATAPAQPSTQDRAVASAAAALIAEAQQQLLRESDELTEVVPDDADSADDLITETETADSGGPQLDVTI